MAPERRADQHNQTGTTPMMIDPYVFVLSLAIAATLAWIVCSIVYGRIIDRFVESDKIKERTIASQSRCIKDLRDAITATSEVVKGIAK
jgi:hypothetical protein